MTTARITFIEQYRKPEGLADRARRRRAEALERRMACIVATTTDGEGIVEHMFTGVPRLVDLIAQTGPDVRIVGVRMESVLERRRSDAAFAVS